MNDQKLEGTVVFEGLLQGPVPNGGDIAARLNQWVQFVGRLGLRFSLETRDTGFSLLPENRPVSVGPLGDSPDQAIRQSLEQLVEQFPIAERNQLFSTLRSSEYRKGEEIQTMYTIVEGTLRLQSRTLAADTVAPPEPIPIKEQIKMAVIGVALALGLLGIALLFPGVRAMFGQLVAAVKPLDTQSIAIDLGAFAPYFTCTIDEKQSDRSQLVVQLKRTEKFPNDEAALNTAAAAENVLDRRLALEGLARGYLRVELFDADGKYAATDELRIRDLRDQQKLDAKLPLPDKTTIEKIVFVP